MRRALAITTLALLTGCFEEPVAERLTLRFRSDGAVEVTAVTTLRPDQLAKADPASALGRRLRETERALLAGEDVWSARFAVLAPISETYRWEKQEGLLARVERTALLADPGQLEDLFADSAILATYTAVPEEGWAELGLFPAGSSARASRREQQRLEEALEPWSRAVAVHLAAVEDLYRYLERSPDRAPACLESLFDELLPDETPELTAEELELVAAVDEAMDEVFEVLVVERGEAATLNELSRRVHDPFPSPVVVEVPGEILEVEGFEVAPGGSPALTIPGLGLWASLSALEGRWITPDPVLAYVRLAQEDDDAAAAGVADFIATPRSLVPAPEAGEVRTALETLLRPEPAYRVVWRTASDRTTRNPPRTSVTSTPFFPTGSRRSPSP